MVVESDVIAAIEQLEYVKAKYFFSKFLKQILLLLVKQNPSIDLNSFQSVSNSVFYILSSNNQKRDYFELLGNCVRDLNFPDLLIETRQKLLDLKDSIPDHMKNANDTEEWRIISNLLELLQIFRNNVLQILRTDSLNRATLLEFNDKIADINFTYGQHKDLLRYLSESLFKHIGCKNLTFQNDAQIEAYVKGKTDIGDDMGDCNYDGKVRSLLELWKDMERLTTGTYTPLNTVQRILQLVNVTNSSSFTEFEKEILDLVNFFDNLSFSWDNLKKRLILRTGLDIHNSSSDIITTQTSRVEPVQLITVSTQTSPNENESKQYPKEIIDESRIMFSDTLLDFLKKTPEDMSLEIASNSQMYNKVKNNLNNYFVTRLNKIIGGKQNVSEDQLKKLFEKSTLYENFFNRASALLNTTDSNRMIGDIRSMITQLKKFYEIFDTSNETIIITELDSYKKTVAAFEALNETMDSYLTNVNSALSTSGCTSTKQLAKDLSKLCDAFYKANQDETCSLNNIANFLSNIKDKMDSLDLFEKKCKSLVSESNNLKSTLKPLMDIQSAFQVPILEIVEFVESVLRMKPPKSKNDKYFDQCIYTLQNSDRMRQDISSLKKSEEGLKNYIQSLETELLNASEYKVKLNFCEQQLNESKEQLIGFENETFTLKEENEAFKDALNLAAQHNNQYGNYINELENEIKELKEK